MLLLAAGFVALFCERLSGQNFTAIWRGFRAVGVMQRVGALLATGCSFWAVGRYDAVEHRILATRTCEKQARRAGIAGIAISQTLAWGCSPAHWCAGGCCRTCRRGRPPACLPLWSGHFMQTGVATAPFTPLSVHLKMIMINIQLRPTACRGIPAPNSRLCAALFRS